MKDKEIVGDLAKQIRDIADSELMADRRRRWTRLNDLDAANDKPLLLIYPEGSWREIEASITLECSEANARNIEMQLRKKLFQYENFLDDMVIEPYFEVPYMVNDDGWGVEIIHNYSNISNGSYKAVPPLQNLKEDLSKLKFRNVYYDSESTRRNYDITSELLAGILPVKLRSDFFWSAGLTRDLIDLTGLEELLFLMFDDPDNLHKLLAFLRDDYINYMSQLEALNIVDNNSNCWHIGSGGLGFNSTLPHYDGKGNSSFKKSWGLLESQETVGVSPAMFGEFIWPYQKDLAKQFGLLYYGCCEPVETRFEYIKEAENLRGISVSPWSDMAKCAELYGDDYVLYRKPNPGLVCVDFCEEAIRKDINKTLAVTGDLNLAIILKDLHTVSNDLSRYSRWSKIARSEIERKY